jgi:hypothetical protein
MRSINLLALAIAISALAAVGAGSEPGFDPRFDGFNVIAAPGHPFGSESARLSLTKAKQLGAGAIAVVPFLWQSSTTSPDIVRGEDMDDAELRTAIRDAHSLGLAVMVKPHVWVPQSWAGAIVMSSEEDWREWFANYQRELNGIALIAEEEKADALVIGTELSAATLRPDWIELIVKTRSIFSGRMIYIAHNVEDAEAFPLWDRLDAIGVSLYPPLGDDGERDDRLARMRAISDRLDALSARTEKPIIVGEIGLRSAKGAAAKPWESAEERVAAADPALQADVLADWLSVLHRPAVSGVLIWRWLTDPNAGGMTDTDFTVQDKPAEHVLKCAWTQNCDRSESGLQSH